jgi:hypothetical protein
MARPFSPKPASRVSRSRPPRLPLRLRPGTDTPPWVGGGAGSASGSAVCSGGCVGVGSARGRSTVVVSAAAIDARRDAPLPRRPRRVGVEEGRSTVGASVAVGTAGSASAGAGILGRRRPRPGRIGGMSAPGTSDCASPAGEAASEAGVASPRRGLRVRLRGRASPVASGSDTGASPLAARDRFRNESHSDSLGGLLNKILDATAGGNLFSYRHKCLCCS